MFQKSINACKNIGLAVNTRKIEYMEIRSYQGMMANEHGTVAWNWYERTEAIKYLGSLLRNQNYIHE